MAKIQKCDGCGKLSPDEQGLHIANGWTYFKIERSEDRVWNKLFGVHEIELCQDCLPLPERDSWAKSVIQFMKRAAPKEDKLS